jgi:hypothetical protein
MTSSICHERKIRGYINLAGYRVTADEILGPGRYGFIVVHDTEEEHLFTSDEPIVIREWMKAIIKTSVDSDYARSSSVRPFLSAFLSMNPLFRCRCLIPNIPLTVTQATNPLPRACEASAGRGR